MTQLWSCIRIPCPCASSKAQDAASCWCVREVDAPVCLRSSCKAPMRKTSPGVPVASGVREGQRIPDALCPAKHGPEFSCMYCPDYKDEGELADKNDPRG